MYREVTDVVWKIASEITIRYVNELELFTVRKSGEKVKLTFKEVPSKTENVKRSDVANC